MRGKERQLFPCGLVRTTRLPIHPPSSRHLHSQHLSDLRSSVIRLAFADVDSAIVKPEDGRLVLLTHFSSDLQRLSVTDLGLEHGDRASVYVDTLFGRCPNPNGIFCK